MPFTVTGRDGRGTLHAEATGTDGAGNPVTTAVEIDVATGAGRVALSPNGSLDAQEAALALERPKLGDAAYGRRLAELQGGGAAEHFDSARPPARARCRRPTRS